MKPSPSCLPVLVIALAIITPLFAADPLPRLPAALFALKPAAGATADQAEQLKGLTLVQTGSAVGLVRRLPDQTLQLVDARSLAADGSLEDASAISPVPGDDGLRLITLQQDNDRVKSVTLNVGGDSLELSAARDQWGLCCAHRPAHYATSPAQIEQLTAEHGCTGWDVPKSAEGFEALRGGDTAAAALRAALPATE